jgi:hypothetical protein
MPVSLVLLVQELGLIPLCGQGVIRNNMQVTMAAEK